MTEEKKILINKIDTLLAKRTAELVKELPDVHEVGDGIIIRFFGGWDYCDENRDIKFKKIKNISNPDETVLFFYLPKNAVFDFKQRDYIECITCLNGKLEIETDEELTILENFNKICLNSNMFQGRALENTYLITTSKT